MARPRTLFVKNFTDAELAEKIINKSFGQVRLRYGWEGVSPLIQRRHRGYVVIGVVHPEMDVHGSTWSEEQKAFILPKD